MSKKIKILIAAGGTGGHVIPGCNLAKHLIEKDYDIELVSDVRGNQYLEKIKDLEITTLPSSPLKTKNFYSFFISSTLIFYSILKSLLYLIFNRPSLVIGMGGYASFPICIAAGILKIKMIIYENNLVIGKANKYLLPFVKNIIVSFKDIEGIPVKYNNKIIEIGNIIKKEIINFSDESKKDIQINGLSIIILGGSQAAKIFADTLPSIFLKCSTHGIPLKVYQQCLPSQNEKLSFFFKNNNIDFEIFNFKDNLKDYFSKVNLAITRSGSSILAELTNSNIPFISVPLPTSADNHQLKNALFYKKKKLAFLIKEKDLNDDLFNLIKEIYQNNLILNNIKKNQRQYSDKNVYNNINQVLKKIINEKN